jgi:hypothetical protein
MLPDSALVAWAISGLSHGLRYVRQN